MKAALIAAAALLAVLAPPTYGQGSVPRAGFGGELRVGLAAAVSLDEVSLESPAFRVSPQELGSTTRFEGVLLLPTIGGRIRPQARVALAPNARVEGLLGEPTLCPTCRDAFAGHVDRLDLMVGVEVSMFPETPGRVRPYAAVGAGVRRYSYSYDVFDFSGGGVSLEGNSFSETGALGRLGLGLGFELGAREVNLEGSMQVGRLGKEIPPDTGYGRDLVLDFGLGLGLRQNF